MYRKISVFIRKARDKAADLLDDFLWFLKSNYSPQTPYTSNYWMGEIQRIANRSPQKRVKR